MKTSIITSSTEAGMSSARAVIRKLTIEQFRGIEKSRWLPESGVDVILGGRRSEGHTVLEAIALLLNPSNVAIVPFPIDST